MLALLGFLLVLAGGFALRDECDTHSWSGCTTCRSDAAFTAMRKRDEGAMSNWSPGEFPLVDEKRALWRSTHDEARHTGDYRAACRVLRQWDVEHGVGGV